MKLSGKNTTIWQNSGKSHSRTFLYHLYHFLKSGTKSLNSKTAPRNLLKLGLKFYLTLLNTTVKYEYKNFLFLFLNAMKFQKSEKW